VFRFIHAQLLGRLDGGSFHRRQFGRRQIERLHYRWWQASFQLLHALRGSGRILSPIARILPLRVLRKHRRGGKDEEQKN